MECFLANADFHWERLESSKNCFEPGPDLAEAVHIIDVPCTAKEAQNGRSATLRINQCTNMKTLEHCLNSTHNDSYSVRFM
jgi:hypothetical protein